MIFSKLFNSIELLYFIKKLNKSNDIILDELKKIDKLNQTAIDDAKKGFFQFNKTLDFHYSSLSNRIKEDYDFLNSSFVKDLPYYHSLVNKNKNKSLKNAADLLDLIMAKKVHKNKGIDLVL